MSATVKKLAPRARIYLDPWVVEDLRKMLAEANDPATGDGKHPRVISDRNAPFEWIGRVSAHLEQILKQVRT